MVMIHNKAIIAMSMMVLRKSLGWMPHRHFACHSSSSRRMRTTSSSVVSAPFTSILDRTVDRNRDIAVFSTTTTKYDDGKETNGESDMVNVTLETASKQTSLKVQKGEVLRRALLRRGVSPHNGRARLINCRGLGTCGTCAVEIEGNDDAIVPAERNTKERLRLNFPPHGSPDQSPNLRLACQVQVKDDIVIRKRTGFWGQDTDELAEGYDAELWFGNLEYLLDSKSPPDQK
ncbi:unnamed protein product [Cylindrotheca closterium]|uniref:2Fe-2S ferredoxin-type domain-containing protein n=1 Tax=Cylindrotheca closterium TaxID=2856 RepID=A0AAD2GBE1_9STRA|nr:unnamed protein product [Cylindrotheca closterium]